MIDRAREGPAGPKSQSTSGTSGSGSSARLSSPPAVCTPVPGRACRSSAPCAAAGSSPCRALLLSACGAGTALMLHIKLAAPTLPRWSFDDESSAISADAASEKLAALFRAGSHTPAVAWPSNSHSFSLIPPRTLYRDGAGLSRLVLIHLSTGRRPLTPCDVQPGGSCFARRASARLSMTMTRCSPGNPKSTY